MAQRIPGWGAASQRPKSRQGSPVAVTVQRSVTTTCPPTGSVGMVMPPPNSVLTATVGEGQLAPPDALHTAVLLGDRQLSPAPGVSLSSTLDASSGPLFDVPPVLSSRPIWSPIPNETEIGREEAVYRRADHRLPA